MPGCTEINRLIFMPYKEHKLMIQSGTSNCLEYVQHRLKLMFKRATKKCRRWRQLASSVLVLLLCSRLVINEPANFLQMGKFFSRFKKIRNLQQLSTERNSSHMFISGDSRCTTEKTSKATYEDNPSLNLHELFGANRSIDDARGRITASSEQA